MRRQLSVERASSRGVKSKWGFSCELSSTAALCKVSGLTGSSPSRMEAPKQYSGAQIQPLGSHTWERWAGSRLSGQPARKKWHRPCRAGGPTCPTCPHHWIPAAAAAGWPCPPAARSGPAPHGPAASGQRGGTSLEPSNMHAQVGPPPAGQQACTGRTRSWRCLSPRPLTPHTRSSSLPLPLPMCVTPPAV